jgi:hypothetical protein
MLSGEQNGAHCFINGGVIERMLSKINFGSGRRDRDEDAATHFLIN